jgi:hypothetical protein
MELTDYLNEAFSIGVAKNQWKDNHITIDFFGGEVLVWNNLNMRYCHRRFKNDEHTKAVEAALSWLKNEYDGTAQPVPEQYQI